MLIKGLHQAVEEYQHLRFRKQCHGILLFNTETGLVMCDLVYDNADLSWNYDFGDPSVVDLDEMMCKDRIRGLFPSDEITEENVTAYLRWKYNT